MLDPNLIFVAVVSVMLVLGIIATIMVYLSDYFQKHSRPTHKTI